MIDEVEVRAIADRCARFIRICGDRRGVVDADLAKRIDAYRDLDSEDRFRVQMRLCASSALARLPDGRFYRFYPRALAPSEAVCARDPSAP